MKRRILSILLILCIVLMQLPSTAFAENGTEEETMVLETEKETETQTETQQETETQKETQTEKQIKSSKAKAKSKAKTQKVATQAATVNYDLAINGYGFDSDNLTLKGSTGNAVYDPNSKTLTLNNYSVTIDWDYGMGIQSKIDGLTIVVNGTNTINLPSSLKTRTEAISSDGSIKIIGKTGASSDKLIINSTCASSQDAWEDGTTRVGISYYNSDYLTMENVTFTMNDNSTSSYLGHSSAIYSNSTNKFTMKNCVLNTKNTQHGVYMNMGYAEISNTIFDVQNDSILDSSGVNFGPETQNKLENCSGTIGATYPIYTYGNLEVSGKNKLTLNATEYAVVAKKYSGKTAGSVKFTGVDIEMNAKMGVDVEDTASATLNSGTLTIKASEYGIRVLGSGTALTVNDGTLDITGTGDKSAGILSGGTVDIKGGNHTFNIANGAGYATNSGASALNISNGTVTMNAPIGINSEGANKGSVKISGGTLNLNCTNAGISTQNGAGKTSITGGTVTITDTNKTSTAIGINAGGELEIGGTVKVIFKNCKYGVKSTNNNNKITGGTVELSGSDIGLYLQGDFAVTGGQITSSGSGSSIRLEDSTVTLGGGTLNLSGGTHETGQYPIYIGENATLDFAGANVEVDTSIYFAIAVNGGDYKITGGTVTLKTKQSGANVKPSSIADGYGVWAGSSESTATIVDNVTDDIFKQNKYIRIAKNQKYTLTLVDVKEGTTASLYGGTNITYNANDPASEKHFSHWELTVNNRTTTVGTDTKYTGTMPQADATLKAVYNNCSGGTATCQERAICTTCHKEYGSLGEHEYTAEKVDPKYLKSEATCKSGALYYKSCTVCGESSKGTGSEATFTSGSVADHDHSGQWESDANEHWKICGVCTEKIDTASHTFGDWVTTKQPTTTAKGEETRTCSICSFEEHRELPMISKSYPIVVTNGKAMAYDGDISEAQKGTIVTVTADPAETGKKFDKWIVVKGSITFNDASSAVATFEMPEEDVEIKATYKDAEYTIKVTDGKASVNNQEVQNTTYKTVVTVTADSAETGKRFDKWVVVKGSVAFSNVNSATTTFEMPAEDVEIKATYKDIEYAINVTDGKASVNNQEVQKATYKTVVTIVANSAETGKRFDKWVVVKGSVAFSNVNSATTTFEMPAEDVEIKATYRNVEDVIEITTEDELTAAVNEGGKIKLMTNIDINSTIIINKDVTLDLNGYVLNMNGSNRVISINSNGKLTLIDSNPTVEHKFTVGTNGLWVLDEVNGTKIIKGGVITGGKADNSYNDGGGGVYVDENATFNMLGGNIVGCINRQGAGVFIQEGATFNMSAGTISGCIAQTTNDDTRGGGICNFGTTILSGNAIIQDCRAISCGEYRVYRGGGVCSTGNFLIKDNVRILDCIADTRSDAMYIARGNINAQIEISSGTFDGNIINEGIISGGTFNGSVKGAYTVTFDSDGGSTVLSQIRAKAPATKPANPTKLGYTFLGWYNGDKKYDFNINVTENLTLKAKWSADSYSISYQGMDGAIAGTNYPNTHTYDTATVVSNPTKLGYTFEGWLVNDSTKPVKDLTLGATDYTSNITLIATWMAKQYTIVFDTVGGTPITDKTNVKWSDKVLDGLTNPIKSGWEFTGWKCGNTVVNANTTYSELVENDTATSITLTAQWKDVEKPTGEIIVGNNKWSKFQDEITFDTFFKEKQTITITAHDNSNEVVEIEYLLSESKLTEADFADKTFTKYVAPFDISLDNPYIIYVKLTDATKNSSYICSQGMILDSVAPVVSGIEEGKIYCEAKTVKVTEKYMDTVIVNNQSVTLDENNEFVLSPADGEQRVVVTDKAGNTTSLIVTVHAGHTYELQSEDGKYWKKCKICGSETQKKIIPEIVINSVDKVCRTQNYSFSFVLPEDNTLTSVSYEFEGQSGDVKATLNDGVYTAQIDASGYLDKENSFKVVVQAKTEDGYAFKTEKEVTILNEHIGGIATCHTKAKCEVCGEEYGEFDANNHDGETGIRNVKTVTCTIDGYTGDTYCKGCDIVLIQGQTIEATGHSGGTATCHTKAKCEICGEEYGELDAKNHDGETEIRDAKKATCTEEGYTGDTYCKGCDELLESGEAIEATGHSGGIATCSQKAKCEICGEAYGKLNPENHIHLKHMKAKAATKDAEGNTEYWYCPDCKKYYKDAKASKETSKEDTILKKLPNTKPSAPTKPTNPSNTDKQNTTHKTPQTGDESMVLLWLVWLLMSGIGIGGISIYNRKKK